MTDKRLEAIHALCLERLAFFSRKLDEHGYYPYYSAELECFFEDDKGGAVHVDRQKVQDWLKQSSPHLWYFGNDIKMLNDPRFADKAQKLYAWGKQGQQVITGGKEGWASRILGPMGLEHRVVPWFARQYEAEFLPDPQVFGVKQAMGRMPDFLRDVAQMEQRLNDGAPQLGFRRVSRYSKSYPHTLGRVAAPSLHLNVSLWREKDGKAINCFASDIPGAATKKGEVFEMAPPPLAMRCMRAMTVLQKDGLALLSEPTNYNFALRHVQGYLAPKWIYHAPGKQMEYAVCYRSQPGDPHFARIENRAPSARSDPYLAMTMTMGAMYMAVCRKQFAAWEKRSEWAPADMNQYRPEQMAGSEPLLEVLGLPLYREALMYYGVDGRDVPRRAAGMRRA